MTSPSPISRRSVGRNVYGEAWKECFRDLQVSNRTPDGALLAASTKMLVACWESGGGGTVGVIDHDDVGKRNPPVTLFRGHKGAVHDVKFSPYYDTIFATASEDGSVKLWDCPTVQAREESCRDAVATLQGHDKKVSYISFHHVSEWIIASAGVDCTIRTWDFEAQRCVRTTTAPQAPNCLEWNYTGSLLGFATKDHHVRVIDPRQNAEVVAMRCHEGGKPIKCCWLGSDRNPSDHYLLSTGFSKLADREMALWDIRKSDQCVQKLEVDRQSSTITPMFDSGTDLLFVYGRGDGNIRFYELKEGHLGKLGVYNSTEPARELSFIPKRGVDVMRCEVMRAYKLQGSNVIQPTSFFIPRRNKSEFQSEVFPPCHGGEPANSAADWLSGSQKGPILRSMEPVDGQSPFDCNRRPLPGALSFSPRRKSTTISRASSVLAKQLTAHEKHHDDVVGRLQGQITELEQVISAKDVELVIAHEEITTLTDELRNFKQYVSPAATATVTDEQMLAESLRETREGVMSALRELHKLREETKKNGDSTQQEVEEMKKLLQTGAHAHAQPTVPPPPTAKESRWRWKSKTAEHTAAAPADNPSTAVEHVLERCKTLERRNMELEALLVQLRVASGMQRSRRNGAVLGKGGGKGSSDVEVWVGGGDDVLSHSSYGAKVGCAPGLTVCRGPF